MRIFTPTLQSLREKAMYNFHLYLPIVTESTYTQVLAIIAVISHHHPGKRYWYGA